MTTTHELHGLRVTSEVPLPDAAPATSGRDADVEVRLARPRLTGDAPPPGDLLVDHEVAGHRQYAAARTPDGVCFRVPGFADFHVVGTLGASAGGVTITCVPDPRPPGDYLPLMLTGNVLSFCMAMAGHTVLHAGAVEIDGRAVAVVGPSGAGKSTLTAWLCAAGARLVTDDVLRVEPDLTCHRGGWEVRLRDRARPLASLVARTGGRVRRTVDGRHAVRPGTTPQATSPVSAVLVPRPRHDAATLDVQRLDPMSAALVLAGVPRTLGWRASQPQRTHFATVTSLAEEIGVHVVDVPWGPPFDVDTADRLVARLDGIEPLPGLAAGA